MTQIHDSSLPSGAGLWSFQTSTLAIAPGGVDLASTLTFADHLRRADVVAADPALTALARPKAPAPSTRPAELAPEPPRERPNRPGSDQVDEPPACPFEPAEPDEPSPEKAEAPSDAVETTETDVPAETDEAGPTDETEADQTDSTAAASDQTDDDTQVEPDDGSAAAAAAAGKVVEAIADTLVEQEDGETDATDNDDCPKRGVRTVKQADLATGDPVEVEEAGSAEQGEDAEPNKVHASSSPEVESGNADSQPAEEAAPVAPESQAAEPTDEVDEAETASRRAGRLKGDSGPTRTPDQPGAQPVENREAAPAVKTTAGPEAAAAVPQGAEAQPGAAAPTVSVEAPADAASVQGGSSRTAAVEQARSAGPAAGPQAEEGGGVDRVRFVQRVARAFEAIGDRGGTVRLRLHPPELGSLRLELTVKGGAMTARVEADNPTARHVLLDNLPALRDRLAQQDIRVERFDVDLSGRSAGGSPQEPGSHHQPHDRPGGGLPQGDNRRGREGEPQPPTPTRPLHDPTRFDVTI